MLFSIGFLSRVLIFGMVIAFLFYNMDMLNKIRMDVQYLRSRVDAS